MKLNLNNFGKKLKIHQRSRKKQIPTEEELFIDSIGLLDFCWDRSNKLYNGFGISILEYEEGYYRIIEDLILIKYGLWKAEIIMWYIFGRWDDKGKLLPLRIHNELNKEIYIKNPLELWTFLQKQNDEK